MINVIGMGVAVIASTGIAQYMGGNVFISACSSVITYIFISSALGSYNE